MSPASGKSTNRHLYHDALSRRDPSGSPALQTVAATSPRTGLVAVGRASDEITACEALTGSADFTLACMLIYSLGRACCWRTGARLAPALPTGAFGMMRGPEGEHLVLHVSSGPGFLERNCTGSDTEDRSADSRPPRSGRTERLNSRVPTLPTDFRRGDNPGKAAGELRQALGCNPGRSGIDAAELGTQVDVILLPFQVAHERDQ